MIKAYKAISLTVLNARFSEAVFLKADYIAFLRWRLGVLMHVMITVLFVIKHYLFSVYAYATATV